MTRYVAKACLFCGEGCFEELYPRNFRDEDLHTGIFSARRVSEHFHYRMVRCRNTGLVFAREILPEEKLRDLYAGSAVTFGRYTDVIRRDYWKPLARRAQGLRRGKALEIGCSSGFFLEELKARGFAEVHGCEPSREARELAPPGIRENIHAGFFTEAFPEDGFDLICSFQTLDHLSDPLSVLSACLGKLKPGGLLYLIVHDADSLQARIFGEKSPIIDVEHVYLFSAKTLSLAVEKAGFATEAVFPITNAYPLEYLIGHSPLPFKAGLHALARGLGLSRLRLPLRLGNLGILAKRV